MSKANDKKTESSDNRIGLKSRGKKRTELFSASTIFLSDMAIFCRFNSIKKESSLNRSCGMGPESGVERESIHVINYLFNEAMKWNRLRDFAYSLFNSAFLLLLRCRCCFCDCCHCQMMMLTHGRHWECFAHTFIQRKEVCQRRKLQCAADTDWK